MGVCRPRPGAWRCVRAQGSLPAFSRPGLLAWRRRSTRAPVPAARRRHIWKRSARLLRRAGRAGGRAGGRGQGRARARRGWREEGGRAALSRPVSPSRCLCRNSSLPERRSARRGPERRRRFPRARPQVFAAAVAEESGLGPLGDRPGRAGDASAPWRLGVHPASRARRSPLPRLCASSCSASPFIIIIVIFSNGVAARGAVLNSWKGPGCTEDALQSHERRR